MVDKTYNSNDNMFHYRSPKIKVVFVKVQNILCSSPLGEKNATEMEEGNDNW